MKRIYESISDVPLSVIHVALDKEVYNADDLSSWEKTQLRERTDFLLMDEVSVVETVFCCEDQEGRRWHEYLEYNSKADKMDEAYDLIKSFPEETQDAYKSRADIAKHADKVWSCDNMEDATLWSIFRIGDQDN